MRVHISTTVNTGWTIGTVFILTLSAAFQPALAEKEINLGLSAQNYQEGKVPDSWNLRRRSLKAWYGEAKWTTEKNEYAVKLHSKDALTFLEKEVDISLQEYPIVTWKWKVDNIISGFNEESKAGDDHPIRLFFVFAPDSSKQPLWFRVKRFLYLDLVHGHPFGGRFTEYLWSSNLEPGQIIRDPGKPEQKLIVVNGGKEKLGQWVSHQRNLYKDYKKLYNEEPRKLIFIGILNDTDQTGKEAVSYITDLKFSQSN